MLLLMSNKDRDQVAKRPSEEQETNGKAVKASKRHRNHDGAVPIKHEDAAESDTEELDQITTADELDQGTKTPVDSTALDATQDSIISDACTTSEQPPSATQRISKRKQKKLYIIDSACKDEATTKDEVKEDEEEKDKPSLSPSSSRVAPILRPPLHGIPKDRRRSARLADRRDPATCKGVLVASGEPCTRAGIARFGGYCFHHRKQEWAVAAEWLANADALIIGTGSGMSVSSGIPALSGLEEASGLRAAKISFEEVCNSSLFNKDPALAWGFWGFCHRTFLDAEAHSDYALVQRFADLAPLGSFCLTSTIDSLWRQAGWPSETLVELHGDVRTLRCSAKCGAPDWPAAESLGIELPDLDELQQADSSSKAESSSAQRHRAFRARGKLPACPACRAVARPAVWMFGDEDTSTQKAERYLEWIKELEARSQKDSLRIVCLEIGCSRRAAPQEFSVRSELQRVVEVFENARLIRVNTDPGDAEIPQEPSSTQWREVCVSLQIPASEALENLQQNVFGKDSAPMCKFIVRDHENVAREVEAPVTASALRVLHLLEHSGVTVQYGKLQEPREPLLEPYVVFFSQYDSHELALLTSQASPKCFCHAKPDSPTATVCLQAMNVWFKAESSETVLSNVEWCRSLLTELIAKLDTPEYQEDIRKQRDRRGVAAMVTAVEEAVLPKFGLTADEHGLLATQAKCWIYGCCDPEIFRLAEESMRLSYIRLSGNLPWEVVGKPVQKRSRASTEQSPGLESLELPPADPEQPVIDISSEFPSPAPTTDQSDSEDENEKAADADDARSADADAESVFERRRSARIASRPAGSSPKTMPQLPRRSVAPKPRSKAAAAQAPVVEPIPIATVPVVPIPQSPAVSSKRRASAAVVEKVSARITPTSFDSGGGGSSSSRAVPERTALAAVTRSQKAKQAKAVDVSEVDTSTTKHRSLPVTSPLKQKAQLVKTSAKVKPKVETLAVVSRPNAKPTSGRQPGRGTRVRILDNPTYRGLTGTLVEYMREADSWQVHGETFGLKWFPASSLAFFVETRSKTQAEE